MSIVFSKNKEKRARSSSSEANNSSFVKNVTSRVSGLLPAAVAKWFSSPSSSSNANGSTQTADATDSSTEDEAPESPIVAHPPPKRMRFTSPANYKHYATPELNCISSNRDQNDLDRSSYGTVASPPGRTTFRRETNYASTPLRLDDSEVSDKESTMHKSQTPHIVSTIGPSIGTKRKSLFDTPGAAEASMRACAKTASNTMRDPKEPCFKPGLLGSPFYPGRTIYGGASSSYINRPNIKQRKNTLVNEANTSDNTVSHSTRRIMDLLENYSSPLSEARRIPQYTRTPRNNSLSSSLSSTSPPSNKVLSYKTQELHVPSIASILRLKQRSRLMDSTTAARQLIASHSSTSDYVPYTLPNSPAPREQTDKESSSKLVTKVKTQRHSARPKRRGVSEAETELPASVDLPSAVLQIDHNNLPTFSFKPPVKTTTQEDKPTTKITETRKPDIVTSSQAPYKFSSPVRISSEDKTKTSSIPTELPKFTFGSPDCSVDKINEKKNDDVSCVVGATIPDKITASKSKDWQCPDCWVNNKTDVDACVCCGGKKPSAENKPAKCTVCKLADSQINKDKCVNCEKMKVNSISAPPLKKKDDSTKWKCGDCWVDNEESAEKCVCCGGSNPKKAAPKQNAVANDADSEWKCNDCWIKNKSSLDKCAACGGAKPGAKPTISTPAAGLFNTPITKPPDNSFSTIAKSQSDKWECSSCLVRNDGNRTRCVCCETEKPGSIKESDKKSFNFGMNTNTSFKFGIPPSMQETSKPAEVPTATITSKKEESETNNNILSKTPTFTFGLPAKKPADETDSTKKPEEKTEKTEPPKMNFSFGIPKSLPSSTPSTTPMFGVPAKPAEPIKKPEENTEKPQEVPKVDFSIPKVQETPKPISNIFGSPLASTSAASDKPAVVPAPIIPEKPQPIGLLFNATPTDASKSVTSNPLSIQPVATTVSTVLSSPATAPAPAPVTAPATTPSFTFGSGGIKPATNLFAAPTTTAAAPITFGSLQSASTTSSPFQQKSEPTKTTSAMSLFSKSETPSSVSLFAKADTPATTAAPAPMFSFGNTAQSTQPEISKPQFNFTFGSANKTESTPLFGATQPATENKFTFGATENKFALPSSNALGGNGLSNSTLGATGLSNNPLSTGTDMNNPLGGNTLQTSNSIQPSGGLFGANVQKENMWSTTNNASGGLFSNTTQNTPLQKPAAFTFGASSTPFNAGSSTFGNSAPSGNVFGMSTGNTATNQLFSSPSGPTSGPVFGSPQPAAPMFGSPSVGATPTFGTPNASIPTFEAPSLTPAPAPAFNFGASAQQTTGVFGFGQQAQSGGFNFGAAAGTPQVQFNMGSAPNTAVRRVRKAVRRNTPR